MIFQGINLVKLPGQCRSLPGPIHQPRLQTGNAGKKRHNRLATAHSPRRVKKDTSLNAATDRFKDTFLKFDFDTIPACAQALIDTGMSIQEFLNTCMPLMEIIGEKYEAGEYYLPQLVVAGEMFKTASAMFNAQLKTNAQASSNDCVGKIVIGTPRGDIHNLGKDIFGVLARANGFDVYDLGVDVPPETFIETVEKTGASILGMSSLLTTAFDNMHDVVVQLEKKGLRRNVFVMIGGGATEQSLVAKLGVDVQTRDAYEGIKMIKQAIQN